MEIIWFLTALYANNHFIDDNGITGPDWGHSEVVFKCFCSKMLSAPGSGFMIRRLWRGSQPGISL